MKYLSKYSNGKMVSPAQYITEIICEHLAIKNKKDLHYRFWLSKEWQAFYKSQIFTAYKLLKKYSDKAIIKALQSEDGRKIFSLRAPHLTAIIEHHEILLSQQNTEQKVEIVRNIDSQGKNKSIKKNILDKIKDIDNGN
jgi:hypothetical protein